MIPACLGPQYTGLDNPFLLGGIGTMGVIPGVIFSDGSASTSATTGSDATLKTITIPVTLATGGVMNGNTRGARLRAWGVVANNANAKSARLTVAGTAINVTGAITASQANSWHMEALVLIRTFGATGALSVSTLGAQGSNTPTHIELDTQIASVNLLASFTMLVTAGAQVAGSDVTCDGCIVELF